MPTYIYRDFLLTSFVPEPATLATMILGVGMIGGSLRRLQTGAESKAPDFG